MNWGKQVYGLSDEYEIKIEKCGWVLAERYDGNMYTLANIDGMNVVFSSVFWVNAGELHGPDERFRAALQREVCRRAVTLAQIWRQDMPNKIVEFLERKDISNVRGE